MSKKKPLFALYKGDKFITLGTKREIAEEVGTTLNNINFWASNVYRKRCHSGNGKIVIKIEEDDEHE